MDDDIPAPPAEREPACIASVRFGFNPHQLYDYLCGFPVSPGEVVVVMTRRGEQEVTVAEVKDHSDKAKAWILRRAI